MDTDKIKVMSKTALIIYSRGIYLSNESKCKGLVFDTALSLHHSGLKVITGFELE